MYAIKKIITIIITFKNNREPYDMLQLGLLRSTLQSSKFIFFINSTTELPFLKLGTCIMKVSRHMDLHTYLLTQNI